MPNPTIENPSRYTYITPNGKFKTQAEAATGNNKTPRQVDYIYKLINDWGHLRKRNRPAITTGWSKIPRHPEFFYRDTPDEELIPKHLRLKKKFIADRWATFKPEHKTKTKPKTKYNSKKERYAAQSIRLKLLFAEPDSKMRAALHSPESTKKGIITRTRNYWNSIKDLDKHRRMGIARHKVMVKRYNKKYLLKKANEVRLFSRTLARGRTIRIYYKPETKSSYVEYDSRRKQTIHRVCSDCGVLTVILSGADLNRKCFSCGSMGKVVGSCGEINDLKELYVYYNPKFSICKNASKMGTDSSLLVRHLKRLGEPYSIRVHSKKTLWNYRGRRDKKPQEMKKILLDDTHKTRYLPDLIEERMESLDDFFSKV